jgi:transmembrane sensor
MAELDDEAMAWVVRELAGELDAEERAALQAWYGRSPRHFGAYARAHAIHRSFDQVAIQDNLKPQAEQDHLRPAPILARDEERDAPKAAAPDAVPPPLRQRRVFVAGALAASLAAVAGGALYPRLTGGTVYKTAKGEFHKVRLADQSVLSINGDSEVEVALSAARRTIVLRRGEAWFEVAKDKARPFVVSAGDARVRAVGTAFSVRRRESGADVLVTEGVVEAWSDGGSAPAARLAAGMQAFVADRAAHIAAPASPADIERKLAWREGKLIFQDDPLADAVAEFNRYNRRQIAIADPALRKLPLVGRYRIDQPDVFAEDVRTLFKVPVAVSGDAIRIGAPAPGR